MKADSHQTDKGVIYCSFQNIVLVTAVFFCTAVQTSKIL